MDLRDKLSGVVLTPPPLTPQPSLPTFQAPEFFGMDVLASSVTTNPQNEPEFAANRWIDNFGAGRFIHNAGFNDYRLGDARCGASVSFDGGQAMWTRGPCH
jgi:hypothetical protein